ncbi:metal-sulfur cluster biosynthetic enzyme [Bradyrhizobium sp. i1.4.4]
MTAAGPYAGRTSEIWDRLHDVTDPELDEPVTDLGFVTSVEVDAMDHVHIQFRLPTYWCAANFAFMMADDMRSAATALPWVRGVSVVLGEHMYADKINRGIEQGLSFQETFGSEATGDLGEVRRTFLLKAFQRRQEAVLNHLMAEGYRPNQLVDMILAELRALPVGQEGQGLVRRYLDRRDIVGASSESALAFMSAEGRSLQAEGLEVYVKSLRRVRVNAEFNGALCRGLLSARFDMTTPLPERPKKDPAKPKVVGQINDNNREEIQWQR